MKHLLFLFFGALFMSSSVMAKRLQPDEVPAVVTAEAVFTVPHFPKGDRTQNGGVVQAHHPETQKLLWSIQVYETAYDESLEKDVQDVFIKSLSFDEDHRLLIMADEKGRVHVLNLATRKVTRIE